MEGKNSYIDMNIGDIVYAHESPIGIVAYKTQERIGVMATDRFTGISVFGINQVVPGLSQRPYTSGGGNMDMDEMPTDDYAGKENTKIVVDYPPSLADNAAAKSWNYSLGGFRWYIPSVSEIRWLWINKDAINSSLRRLGMDNWEKRRFTGGKDIELICGSTVDSSDSYKKALHCIRLNEDGRIFWWRCSPYSKEESWSGGFSARTSVYPFCSFRIT